MPYPAYHKGEGGGEAWPGMGLEGQILTLTLILALTITLALTLIRLRLRAA